jgi:hypothetical protein
VQAVDAARLPVKPGGSPAADVRQPGAEVDHARLDRRLACLSLGSFGADHEQAARRDARVFRRAQYVWSLPSNPVASVEKYRQRSSGDIDVFTPEEVLSLVRAASSD